MQDRADEAEPFERRAQLLDQVADEIGSSLRVLTFGRDRDTASEVGLQGAGVNVGHSAGDCGFAGHHLIPHAFR
jgi:hypothetical protein